jgi:hypothetical protein
MKECLKRCMLHKVLLKQRRECSVECVARLYKLHDMIRNDNIKRVGVTPIKKMVETQFVVKFYSKENNQKECRKIIKNCQKKNVVKLLRASPMVIPLWVSYITKKWSLQCHVIFMQLIYILLQW